jgi:hypothetical protein
MNVAYVPSALDQLLLDLFTTALEGGINYWSTCSRYRWMNADGTENHQGFEAIIHDTEDDAVHTIDRSVMAKGYRMATTLWRDRFAWSSGEKPPLVVGPDTDWDFDATDADAILQLGLFEDVVYG